MNGSARTPLKLGKDKDYVYDDELRRLQIELVKLQEWIRHKGLKLVAVFEGRDAAGKGGAIKRITQSLNPRVCRVWPWAPPLSGKGRSGTSSGMWRICRRPAKWSCSTVVGTTGLALSA